MLGERVLQVWRWYLQRFRRYRKKTRGGLEIAPPPVGRGLSIAPYFFAAVNFEIWFLFDEATEGALTDTYQQL